MIKTDTSIESLNRLLSSFQKASQMGLKVHLEGEKRPTVLTHSSTSLPPNDQVRQVLRGFNNNRSFPRRLSKNLLKVSFRRFF